ncbi:NADH-quinone oxidoreductase subunit C [Amycolatopsis vancoresmycina]|uniref:NADH-quinone oxidoreductase subunit C n=1 Tax=Amycolatopsis vancoresmycina DSM 44592 TaxID=1292037 RepID=R1G7U2_9PSEU|nr:NADH-quinone oxidoreductase subunit C [Amycolatopsis vancoresmycina]EOD67482.1 NADH dehydrogenase subunit C [Amycolatopsis vancoresmycina DSM 44592]
MTENPQPGDEQSSAERAETGLTAAGPGAAEPVVTGRERQGMFGVHGTGDTSGYGGVRLPAYSPAPAERPYGGWFDQFADEFYAALAERKIPAEAILQTTVDRGEITFYVAREHLPAIAKTLRDDGGLRFELLSSVSGVDYGVDVPQRLHAVYHFTSLTYRRRIRLEVTLDVEDAHVPSLVETYPTADWQERETWDMFGIVFDGHPALTRILMPDDWDGHPQRKDYPLGGIPVEYKGAEIPPPDQRRSYS